MCYICPGELILGPARNVKYFCGYHAVYLFYLGQSIRRSVQSSQLSLLDVVSYTLLGHRVPRNFFLIPSKGPFLLNAQKTNIWAIFFFFLESRFDLARFFFDVGEGFRREIRLGILFFFQRGANSVVGA